MLQLQIKTNFYILFVKKFPSGARSAPTVFEIRSAERTDLSRSGARSANILPGARPATLNLHRVYILETRKYRLIHTTPLWIAYTGVDLGFSVGGGIKFQKRTF